MTRDGCEGTHECGRKPESLPAPALRSRKGHEASPQVFPITYCSSSISFKSTGTKEAFFFHHEVMAGGGGTEDGCLAGEVPELCCADEANTEPGSLHPALSDAGIKTKE